MRLSCPACGACGSIEFFLMDAAARETVVAALKMPAPLGKQLMTYIGLFRPGKRSLSWDRVENLIGELLPHIQSAQLEFDGLTWAAPIEYWKEALDHMLTNRSTLQLPLKNHNYLYRIVASKSKTSTDRKLQQEEDHRHRGPSERRQGSCPVQVTKAVTPRTGAPQELLDAVGVKKRHAQQ